MFNKVILASVLMAVAQFSFAGKIVIFDPNEAIMRTQFAQQKVGAFEATPEFAKMKAEFEALNAELEILNKELTSKSMTWGDAEKSKHRDKMEQVAKNRKLAMDLIKTEQNLLLKSIFDKYQTQLQGIVKQYMDEKGIDFMLRREAVAVVGNQSSDVTEAIAAELDKLK